MRYEYQIVHCLCCTTSLSWRFVLKIICAVKIKYHRKIMILSQTEYPSYSWCDVGGSTADTVPVPFSLFSAAGIQEVSVHLTFPSVQAPLWTLISHLTFLFSLSTKLWNFVKWDDPGDVTMPTCHLAVCHLSAQEGKASTENREKGKNKWKWVKQRGRVHGNMCVFLSVTTCVCLCLSLCVRASGGLLALG